MQFKIPQNVEVEDKILPFMTLKQLFILFGGGGVAYIIYIVSVGRYEPQIFMIPVSLVLIITVLIAYFRMENITFLKLVVLVLEQLINSQKRIWYHYADPLSPLTMLNIQLEAAKGSPTPAQKESPDVLLNLEQFAERVDTSAIPMETKAGAGTNADEDLPL